MGLVQRAGIAWAHLADFSVESEEGTHHRASAKGQATAESETGHESLTRGRLRAGVHHRSRGDWCNLAPRASAQGQRGPCHDIQGEIAGPETPSSQDPDLQRVHPCGRGRGAVVPVGTPVETHEPSGHVEKGEGTDAGALLAIADVCAQGDRKLDPEATWWGAR